MNDQKQMSGSCLCGAVTYEINGPLRPVIACHCNQCRKQTGHYFAATGTKHEYFQLKSDDTLKWYRSSDTAERGFCSQCGSGLFWRADGSDYIAIGAGSIDGDTGLKLEGHIFCESAGDYYEVLGGDFQLAQSGHHDKTPE